ncbi:MAG: FkbM family methyltransferase [Ferrimicrobium sp.]
MRELFTKSLSLDLALLSMTELPISLRTHLIHEKLRAMAGLIYKNSFRFHIHRNLNIQISSISELGTLQSCIVDFYNDVILSRLLPNMPFIVDIGANIGQWTSSVKLLVPNARVLAIEPDPSTYRRLKNNLSPLTDVECANYAVGIQSGSATLYRQPLSTMSTLHPSGNDITNNRIEVQVIPLDELLERSPHIDLLKIDVEGAELDVIRGASHTLQNTAFLLAELSLGRGPHNGITFLTELNRICPRTRILKFGRPLGNPTKPACQDVLLSLH